MGPSYLFFSPVFIIQVHWESSPLEAWETWPPAAFCHAINKLIFKHQAYKPFFEINMRETFFFPRLFLWTWLAGSRSRTGRCWGTLHLQSVGQGASRDVQMIPFIHITSFYLLLFPDKPQTLLRLAQSREQEPVPEGFSPLEVKPLSLNDIN